jgi:hypothetical protein
MVMGKPRFTGGYLIDVIKQKGSVTMNQGQRDIANRFVSILKLSAIAI